MESESRDEMKASMILISDNSSSFELFKSTKVNLGEPASCKVAVLYGKGTDTA